MDPSRQLVGRSSQQAQLLGALAGATVGKPSATLLHGEPGIGKTSLVRHLIGRAEARHVHVLFGQCLRFGSEVTAHLPFTQAFDHWARGAGPETVRRVFPGAASAGDILGPGHEVQGRAPRTLFAGADAVDRLTDDAPTLLVMDDLQWADPSSLDLLTFIVAGLHSGQRLAVIATYRDTELGEGHRLHGWLADVLRMSHVDRVPVSRLTAVETEQLVAGLPGAYRALGRVEDVYARSDGNPYLAELLAQEVEGAVGHRGELTDALLGSWHRLSREARSTTQVVAVAGRPVDLRVLNDLATGRGQHSEDVAGAITEAIGNGVLALQGSGEVWFRHPLLAEVIAGTLLPWQVTELHRAFAAAWEDEVGRSEAERASRLALHYAAAGDAEPALIWALRAADEASRLRAVEEEAVHLSRAVDLLPLVSTSMRPPTVELLMRAGKCLIAAGRPARAIELYEQALASLDTQREPLVASRVLTVLNFTRQINTGSASTSLADFVRAVELTRPFPSSRERVDALAHLAYFEVFEGNKAAVVHAEEAVAIGEALGVDDALSWALVVRAQTRWGSRAGVDDAERALSLSRQSRDTALLVRVTFNLCNNYESMGRLGESAAVAREVYALVLERRSVQGISSIGSRLVQTLVPLGQWEVARTVIRETLALRLSSRWAAEARGAAAVLSALQGDASTADAHMARARELMPEAGPVDELVVPEMNLALEVGRPRRTLVLAEAAMPTALAVDHLAADELLQLAARAAADLAEGGPGASDGTRRSAVSILERIETLRGDSPPPFPALGPEDLTHPALGALYAADRARCHHEGRGVADLWRTAAAVTERAGLRYEHARCLFFLGRSLLAEPKARAQATDTLRAAAAIANELGAAPLSTGIEQLAQQAHIRLAHPAPDDSGGASPVNELAGVALTPREAEVLDRVVAGDTYAQAARRLFISEKTVSVHISNLLHKTGTSSRIELAALAVRCRGEASNAATKAESGQS